MNALQILVALVIVLDGKITTDASAIRELDVIQGLISNNEHVQASNRVTGVVRYLVSKATPEGCRPQKSGLNGIDKPRATDAYLLTLRESLAGKDYAASCQTAMLLGISISKDMMQATPAARLTQYEHSWAQAGSPANAQWFDQLAWANFEAGQIKKAEEFATSTLETAAKMIPELQPDFYQHSARTLLWLIRLQGGSTAEASALLGQSLDVKPGAILLAGKPAVRLADGLWKRGERQAVIRYLERCEALQLGPYVKADVQKWLAAARSGAAPAFFPNAAGTAAPMSR